MTWGIQPAVDVCMAVSVGHKRLDWCASKAACWLGFRNQMSLVDLARSALAGRTQTAGVTSEAHNSEIFRRSITVELAIGYLTGKGYWGSLQSSTFGTSRS